MNGSVLVTTDFVGMKSIVEMATDAETLQIILEKEDHTVIDVFLSRMIPSYAEFLSIRTECEDEPSYDRNPHECVKSREFLIPMKAIKTPVEEIVNQIEGSKFIGISDEGEVINAAFWDGEGEVYDLAINTAFLTRENLNYWPNNNPFQKIQTSI